MPEPPACILHERPAEGNRSHVRLPVRPCSLNSGHAAGPRWRVPAGLCRGDGGAVAGADGDVAGSGEEGDGALGGADGDVVLGGEGLEAGDGVASGEGAALDGAEQVGGDALVRTRILGKVCRRRRGGWGVA
jgi:hypothetical protein